MERSSGPPPSSPAVPAPAAPFAPPGPRSGCGAPVDPAPTCLDGRQRTVVAALCEGLDRAGIAQRLRRSQSTCDKAISGLYRATGFATAHQVVAWAFRVGLYVPAGRDHDGRDA
ncbi:MAG: hypothetical protein ABI780_00620 [Ardenticatenales bacterium]